MDKASKKVLLVDDDEAIREMTYFQLIRIGYRRENIFQAENGGQALGYILSGMQIDIIITDHNMPTMTGAELVAQLNNRNIKIPIILVTGNPNEAPKTGGNLKQIINKPFHEITLDTAMSLILEEPINMNPPTRF